MRENHPCPAAAPPAGTLETVYLKHLGCGRWTWLRQLRDACAAEEISRQALEFGLTIFLDYAEEQKSGELYAAASTIGARIGMDPRSSQRCLNELLEAGLLAVAAERRPVRGAKGIQHRRVLLFALSDLDRKTAAGFRRQARDGGYLFDGLADHATKSVAPLATLLVGASHATKSVAYHQLSACAARNHAGEPAPTMRPDESLSESDSKLTLLSESDSKLPLLSEDLRLPQRSAPAAADLAGEEDPGRRRGTRTLFPPGHLDPELILAEPLAGEEELASSSVGDLDLLETRAGLGKAPGGQALEGEEVEADRGPPLRALGPIPDLPRPDFDLAGQALRKEVKLVGTSPADPALRDLALPLRLVQPSQDQLDQAAGLLAFMSLETFQGGLVWMEENLGHEKIAATATKAKELVAQDDPDRDAKMILLGRLLDSWLSPSRRPDLKVVTAAA
jgi:hypothetical protein